MTDEQEKTETPQTPPIEEVVAATTEPPTEHEDVPAEAIKPPTEHEDVPAEVIEPPARDPRVPLLIATAAVLAVLTLVFGLMAFAPSVLPIKSGAGRQALAAREERAVTQVAERFSKNFLTIDYRTIDADFDRLTKDATGKFKEQLRQVLNLSKEQFKDRKATSSADITQSFLLRHDEENAVVRVVVDRTITNARTKGPESGVQVLDVTLVQTSGGWKVDNVEQLGAEAAQAPGSSGPAPG